MRKAIYYFAEAVCVMYDKVVPNGKKIDAQGRIKRPGLKKFLIGYLLILFVLSYLAPSVYIVLRAILAVLFFIAIGESLVLYCQDGASESQRHIAGCISYDPRVLNTQGDNSKSDEEEPGEYAVDDSEEWVANEEDDDSENSEVNKPAAQTAGKSVKVYDSPTDEAAVGEVLYGVPFDPFHDVEYRK